MLKYARRFYFDALLYLTNRIVARIPSHTVRLFYYKHCLGLEIGSDSYIFMDAWFDYKGSFTMGSGSVINQRCRLDNRGGISIGNNVSISAEVCILTADHDLQSAEFLGRTRPVSIEDFVFVGTRAIILPGVIVHEGAAIAAGSVVTKSVPPYTIVAGIPAATIGTRPRDLNYETTYGRLFF